MLGPISVWQQECCSHGTATNLGVKCRNQATQFRSSEWALYTAMVRKTRTAIWLPANKTNQKSDLFFCFCSWQCKKMLLFFISLSLMISENTARAQQNKRRTDTELTLAKMHFVCGDARSQERFQRISDPFYLLHFTIFYLSEIKDLSIRGTNLQQREKMETLAVH